MRLFFVVLLFAVQLKWSDSVEDQKLAYVSVLSSDDFLIAARVLGRDIYNYNFLMLIKILGLALREYSPTIPFLLFCTEDISNASIATLTAEGITTERISKLDTPYIATHTAKKYQVRICFYS